MVAKVTSDAIALLRDGASKNQVVDFLVSNNIRVSEAKKLVEDINRNKRDHFILPNGEIMESDL